MTLPMLIDAAEPEGCDEPRSVVAMAGMVLRKPSGSRVCFVEAAGVRWFWREGDDVAVEPCGEVAVGVEDGDVVCRDAEAGDGNESHERPVADEEGGADGE